MTPERWRQLTAMFHGARARDAADRAAFLDRACAGDPSLRAEVESLLASQGTLGPGGSAADSLPQLTAGTMFGSYRVESLIGAGGMGQVYRATDTRLHRTVALKVLAPDLSVDPDFGARFEREARMLASLNHPNIAAIYGFEHAGGVQALALEMVEGPTLSDRLRRGPLSASEALTVARQIALALEAAHDRGIVHRDLKPANIKITPAGMVKVLDFGIARLVEADSNAATSAGTHTGMILGTPAYMSPEQARGLAVDKRTDIWAFGCVLFEMVTGRGAFAGDTASDSLAKVIEREPDWSTLPSTVPPATRKLLARCLKKDPADRLHDIADARIEIGEALSSSSEPVLSATLPRTRTMPVAVGLAAVALAAVAGWMVWHNASPGRTTSGSGPFLDFGITFPNNVIPAIGVSISPDGRYVAVGAFINAPQLWLHSFQPPETRPVPGVVAGYSPFWDPDSSTIAFFSALKLMKTGVAGGSATTIAEVPPAPSGGSWNRNGTIVFSAGEKLYRVPASGGTPVELPIAGLAGVPLGVRFLPDDRHFIFWERRRPAGMVQLASLDTPGLTPIVESDGPAAFAPPDRLVFPRRTSLMTQRIDPTRFVLTGEPEVIASGVVPGFRSLGPAYAAPITVSENGVIALMSPRGGSQGQLTWFGRDGKPGESIEAPPDVEYLNQAFSPDGRFVAVNLLDPQIGTWDVWQLDLARNVPSKLTTHPASDGDPVWSPDGKDIAFVSDRDNRFGLYRQSVAGGPAELLVDLTTSRNAVPSDWTTNGYILLHRVMVQLWSVWAFRLSDRTLIPVMDEQFSPYGARLSPDGEWLAYSAWEGPGPAQVFVRRFFGDAPKKQITQGAGGVHPRWVRRGKNLEVVYWAPPGGIFSTDISFSGSDIRVGATRTLVDRPVLSLIDGRPHYDITQDGERLLVRQPAGPPGPGIRIIANWQSKVAR